MAALALTGPIVMSGVLIATSTALRAEVLTVHAPDLSVGTTWTVLEITEPGAIQAIGPGWESRTFWDLRPSPPAGRLVRWTVTAPAEAGLAAGAASVAGGLGADRALCAFDVESGRRLGCSLFLAEETTAAGPHARWSDLPGASDAERLTGWAERAAAFEAATPGGEAAGREATARETAAASMTHMERDPVSARRTGEGYRRRAPEALWIPTGRGPAARPGAIGSPEPAPERGLAAPDAATEHGPATPEAAAAREVVSSLGPAHLLAVGDSFTEAALRSGRTVSVIEGRAVAEGIVVVPAGPRQAILLREIEDTQGSRTLRYRFLSPAGLELARLEGAFIESSPFAPQRAELLAGAGTFADNGIEISYSRFHSSLRPGSLGFLQYSSPAGSTPLSSLQPSWTTVQSMISIDATGVPYQPDPGDPSSSSLLPEVWDFSGLLASNLTYRSFNTVRDDLAGNTCAQSCALRDVSASPPDGTWQSYLKIDRYGAGGAFSTRDLFDINDNDTGADPSIDVPYVAQDELNVSNRTQICFQQSAGGAQRFLRFFRFTGPGPATATLGVNDTWTSGAWTECDDTHGLRLTAASLCGSQCWPGCSSVDPRARGRLGAGAGFRSTIVDDGWVHVPAGNYLPALLMRQDTDIQAGLDFLTGICNLGTQNNRAFDYFWLNQSYGFLALVSSPSNDTMPADDWSAAGNVTDGADFTWGPYPPYQTEARRCLAGTRVSWSLPADGSNLTGAPGVSGYGYVVSWGSLADPEQLADWTANPNHTPLPGEAGYLAAPPGSEPTSVVITSWPGSSVNATVVTALRYTDPDVADQKVFRSAALYKVTESPARLAAASFRVGQAVSPFAQRSGPDIVLTWPAVPGAASYHLRVWDLATRAEIPCPGTLNCNPPGPTATHTGAALTQTGYGYSAYAVDPCGALSAD